MLRKSFITEKNLKYNGDFEAAEDYRLWVGIIYAGGKTANIPEALLDYRTHDKQVSTVLSAIQYENSLKCRAAMLRLPLQNVSGYDEQVSLAVISNKAVESTKKLFDFLNWLTKLAHQNTISHTYQNFERYVYVTKINFINSSLSNFFLFANNNFFAYLNYILNIIMNNTL